jgi:Flp pilus assembly protein TadD
VPARDPHPFIELEDDDGSSLDLLPSAADPTAAQPPVVPHRRGRGPEAQAAFERALAQAESGDVSGAVSLLRRALALSPGDPEIAEALGKLAFKDRLPEDR